MTSNRDSTALIRNKPVFFLFVAFIILGFGTFIFQLAGNDPERGWQAYLINFLLWSAIAQGGLLFSMVMHLTKARWSQPVQNLAESFAAFFPFSLGLFLLLFLGRAYLFPWLHEDLGGKEVWLNLPFLFWRDLIGLLLLYALGLIYLYYALRLKLDRTRQRGRIRAFIHRRWTGSDQDLQRCKSRMTVLSALYILAYALVLTLIAFDLVMSMDPHWYSTLFGPYSFIKAFYLGLGGLIILAAITHLCQGEQSGLSSSHFHDLGKLFFAFCLLWADFFYAQLLVIWYGNISEETSYVITRTLFLPWKSLAWTVFVVSFVIPFLILLNRKVKTRPIFMIVLCSWVLIGIWFEHLLLLGPALSPQAKSLPLGPADGLITLGFLGLMAMAVTLFLNLFPELLLRREQGVS
jgi:Ni/Fe-hydrogenase subunit HybB-like protein